jgi:hypothetical protein
MTDPLETLRRICLALPEVTERISHGEPTWFVQGKRTFVTYADHHHDDRLAFWCAAPEGAQEVLAGSEPERFFRPPYVGVRGWLGVYLDVPVDWGLIEDLVLDAYRTVAPKRLAEAMDADHLAANERRRARHPAARPGTGQCSSPRCRGLADDVPGGSPLRPESPLRW